jgi:hypothetical protein
MLLSRTCKHAVQLKPFYFPFSSDGPTTATVSGPSSHIDTNGTTPVTLTCNPTTSNPPTPNYTWRRLPTGSVVGSQRTLTLNATRDLDNVTVQCTASNAQFSDISANAVYILNVDCKCNACKERFIVYHRTHVDTKKCNCLYEYNSRLCSVRQTLRPLPQS